MSKSSFDKLISQFGEAWIARDPNAVMDLIATENLKYFESAFEPPTTDWHRVKKLWDVVPDNQENITWWHEILVHDEHKAVTHVKVTRTLLPSQKNQYIDAVFIFGVNKQNKIDYFRQWRELR